MAVAHGDVKRTGCSFRQATSFAAWRLGALEAHWPEKTTSCLPTAERVSLVAMDVVVLEVCTAGAGFRCCVHAVHIGSNTIACVLEPDVCGWMIDVDSDLLCSAGKGHQEQLSCPVCFDLLRMTNISMIYCC